MTVVVNKSFTQCYTMTLIHLIVQINADNNSKKSSLASYISNRQSGHARQGEACGKILFWRPAITVRGAEVVAADPERVPAEQGISQKRMMQIYDAIQAYRKDHKDLRSDTRLNGWTPLRSVLRL